MWPSGNCTSTTGPNTWRIFPRTWVAVVTSIVLGMEFGMRSECSWLCGWRAARLASRSAHGTGAADDVEQLLRDVLLARAVVDLLEPLDHAHGGVGGALHGHAPARVLAGESLQHRAVDHRLEVARDQHVEQRLRVGLHQEVGDRKSTRLNSSNLGNSYAVLLFQE